MSRLRRCIRALLTAALLMVALAALMGCQRSDEAPDEAIVYGTLRVVEQGTPLGCLFGFGSMLQASCGLGTAVLGIHENLPAVLRNPLFLAQMEATMGGVIGALEADAPDCPPIASRYDGTVEFELQQDRDGVYRLARGTVVFTCHNLTSMAAQAGQLTDDFRGGGSLALDPARDSIELTINRQVEPNEYVLNVDIRHPLLVTGDSVMEIIVESLSTRGRMTWRDGYIDSFQIVSPVYGMNESFPPTEPFKKPIGYVAMGPLPSRDDLPPECERQEITRRETYASVGGGQVLVDLTIDPCEVRVEIAGLLGDVVSVDLNETGLSEFAFRETQRAVHPEIPAQPDHTFPANESGYVAQIDRWEETLRNEGRFYYVPLSEGESELRLTGERRDGRETPVIVALDVQDGYSTEGPDMVTFGNDRLDLYRQQQRLKYLGFVARGDRANEAQALLADGNYEYSHRWAVALFNRAVNNDERAGCAHDLTRSGCASPAVFACQAANPAHCWTPIGRAFINASNAPRWQRVPDGGTHWDLVPSDDFPLRHCTSWAVALLEEAGEAYLAAASAAAPRILVNNLSLAAGGRHGRHLTHQVGMSIDLNTPPREWHPGSGWPVPFYRTHSIGGRRYVAAQAPDDPGGDGHVVACQQSGDAYTCQAVPFTAGEPAPADALAHRPHHCNDEALLGAIADLIVDNPDTPIRPYDIEQVRQELAAFAASDLTHTIIYNDPRTWDIPKVRFGRAHCGHYHVRVQPPAPSE